MTLSWMDGFQILRQEAAGLAKRLMRARQIGVVKSPYHK